MKKLYPLFILISLLVLLSGCTSATSETSQTHTTHTETTANQSTVVVETEWRTAEADLTGLGYTTALFTDEALSGNALISEGQLLLIDDTDTGHLVTPISGDGTAGTAVSLTAPVLDSTLSNIQIMQDCLYCLYLCPEDDTSTTFWVQKYTPQGQLLWQTRLYDLLGIPEQDQTFSDIAADSHGLTVAMDQEIFFLDGEGTLLSQIASPGEAVDLCPSSQGDIYLKDGSDVCRLDMDTHTIGDVVFSLSNGEQLYTGSGPYDFLLMNDARLRGVSLEDRCITELASWIDCDLYASVAGVAYLEQNQYAISVYKTPVGVTQLLSLSFLPQESISEKQVVRMAVPAMDPEYWSDALGTKTVYAINAFNRTNPDYRIEIETYDSAEALQLMMTTELPPDLIVFGSTLGTNGPSQQLYASKGYLEDLDTFFDRDPELQETDFLSNVLAAFRRDSGQLYSIAPEFYVETAYVSAEYAAAAPDWTIESIYELMCSLPEDSCFIDTGYPDLAVSFFLSYCVDQFVNVADCSCDFQNQSFYDLLYLCRDNCGLGTPVSNSLLLDGSISSTLTDGLSLMDSSRSVVGYPGAPGNGAAIHCSAEFSIVSTSQVQDGAWEFLRTLLTEDFQSEVTGTMLPIRQDSFQLHLETMAQRNPDIPSEEFTALAELIQGACYRVRSSSPVITIVQEEASAFFAGDKTAEDVAAIIENRVRIYLSEQS